MKTVLHIYFFTVIIYRNNYEIKIKVINIDFYFPRVDFYKLSLKKGMTFWQKLSLKMEKRVKYAQNMSKDERKYQN